MPESKFYLVIATTFPLKDFVAKVNPDVDITAVIDHVHEKMGYEAFRTVRLHGGYGAIRNMLPTIHIKDLSGEF